MEPPGKNGKQQTLTKPDTYTLPERENQTKSTGDKMQYSNILNSVLLKAV